jgi:hypothetical protein
VIDTTGNPFAAGNFVGGADNYLGVSFQDTNIFGGGQVFGFAQIDAVSILRVLYDDMGMDLDLQAALNPGPSPGVGPGARGRAGRRSRAGSRSGAHARTQRAPPAGRRARRGRLHAPPESKPGPGSRTIDGTGTRLPDVLLLQRATPRGRPFCIR